MSRSWVVKLAVGAAALAAVCLLSAPLPADDSGGSLYKTKCAACHGADGKGDTPAGKKTGARDFSSPEVQKMSDAELSEAIAKGKNKMPAYEKSLKSGQLKDLVAYIRTLARKN